ncbi:MAG TPA: PKD domain-containing protein [Nocardioides sp.]|nr:PKD domain-containing protein [Nocardioides sp.]
MAAALLTLLAAFTGQSAHARPPTKPGRATDLAMVVTKPAAAYRLATSWSPAANAASYQVRITNSAGTVLDHDTVSAPSWVAVVTAPAASIVRLTVVPVNGVRKGRSSSLSKALPDLTGPTGTFTVDRVGGDATVTQVALADDVSPASGIARVVDWADGTAPQPWVSGTTIAHSYLGQGLWRPTVTLTDEHGNVSVVQLSAVVIGDETAPTGTFSSGPASAWAAWTAVNLTQLAIHDDFSADEFIVRTVSWGDGTTSPWASGTVLQHVYAGAGTFTPSVAMTDDAGNSSTAAAQQVVVTRDATAPTIRLALPRTNKTSVRSWRTLKGRATDAGTGVKLVRVKAIEKRGARWYAYKPATGRWVRAGALRSGAWAKAGAKTVAPASTGAWQVGLRRLAKGTLMYRVIAWDQVRNVSRPVVHTQKLTRR